jgi:hypothetical protein
MLNPDFIDGTDIVFRFKKQKEQTKTPQSVKRIAANIKTFETLLVSISKAEYPIFTQGKRLPHNAITTSDNNIDLLFCTKIISNQAGLSKVNFL